jgi:hypothetical protein
MYGRSVRKARIASLIAAITASVALLPASSPAEAGEAMHPCQPPLMSGFTWTKLVERGLGCDHAKTLALHAFRHGAPQHYTCTRSISGRTVHRHCHHQDNHHGVPVRAFAFTYYVK